MENFSHSQDSHNQPAHKEPLTPVQQGEVLKEKMLQKAQSVKERGTGIWHMFGKWERVIALGALAGLATALLPWMSMYRESVWGWQVFLDSYLIIPASLVAVLALLYFSQGATNAVKLSKLKWIMIIASFWLGVLAISYEVSSQLMGLASMFGSGPDIGIGVWIMALVPIVMLVGALKLNKELMK